MRAEGRINFRHRTPDSVCVLLLLVIFAVSALLLVVFAARVYEDVRTNAEASSDRTVALSYVASKVRQHDVAGAVRAEERDGVQALVLTDPDGLGETLIYSYEGDIYELYVDPTSDFALTDGIAIISGQTLSFEQGAGGQLLVRTVGADGTSGSLGLTLRAAEGVAQ